MGSTAAGALAGFLVAGPVGFVVGGAAGFGLSNRFHKPPPTPVVAAVPAPMPTEE